MPIIRYTVVPIDIKLTDPTLNNLVKGKLPTGKRDKVTLNINQDTTIANAVRRTLIEELPFKVLITPPDNITTDENLTNDFITGRLRLIPISQKYDDLQGSLFVRNNDPGIMTVYTSDIKFTNKGQEVSVCDGTYRIATLTCGKYLRINNIKTEVHTGYTKGECLIGNWTYRQVVPREYVITFESIGPILCLEILKITFNNLIQRFMHILSFIKDKKESTYSDTLDLALDSSQNQLTIRGESDTIGNCITKFAFIEDESIEYLNFSQPHPTERTIIIKWKHPSGVSIISAGIIKVISVFEQMLKELIIP